MGLDAGGRGGGTVKARKPKRSQREKNVRNHFLGAIRAPSHKSNKGTTTTIIKKYKNTPDVKKKAPSKPSKTSSGYTTPSERRSVGTNGGRTGAVNTTKKGGGNRSGGGGRGRGGSKSGGGGGPGKGRYMKQARRYVNRDIKSQIQTLKDELQDRQKDFAWDESNANNRYTRAEGDLRHVFGEASESNQMQTQAILDRLTGQQGATNQMFDQLGASQQGNTSQNTQALLSELQRLGVEGGANLAPIQQDAAWAQNMGEQGRTNTLANLGAMSQSAGDIGSLISQMANSSMASNIGKQMNLRDQTVAEAQHNLMGERDEIKDQMRLERLQRGNRIFDMYKELEETGYNRWFQNREANRANRLGWSNFNQGVSMDNAGLMMDKAAMLQEQRAAAAQRRAMNNQMRRYGGGGGGGNPIGQAAGNVLRGIFG